MIEPTTPAELQQREIDRFTEGYAETALSVAVLPTQTMEVEAMSQAAMAYAREQDDYELFMKAWRMYLMARRKTTGLIQEEGDGNTRVTYTGYGFTKMQWSRRIKEFEVEQEKIDAYFDELVSNGWQPSIRGMLRHSSGKTLDPFADAMVEILHAANVLDDYPHKLNRDRMSAVEAVLKAFGEK